MAIKHKRLFPQALLTQSSTERLNYFQGITIGHLRLKQALDILLMNLQYLCLVRCWSSRSREDHFTTTN